MGITKKKYETNCILLILLRARNTAFTNTKEAFDGLVFSHTTLFLIPLPLHLQGALFLISFLLAFFFSFVWLRIDYARMHAGHFGLAER